MKIKIFIYTTVLSVLLVFLLCSCFLVDQIGLQPDPEPQTAEQQTPPGPQDENQPNHEPEHPKGDQDSNQEEAQHQDQEMDLEQKRDYFQKGVDHFTQEQYLEAQFYFNRIEDSYLILQDHIYYYLAKALLRQQKYDLSGKYYARLLADHADSIFTEKAKIEYADLAFIQAHYHRAQVLYREFLAQFPQSDFVPYGRFQLAVCQENTMDIQEAINNYQQVWLQFPTNDFADTAYVRLENLIEAHDMEPWVPTADQVFERAMLYFGQYQYHSALRELNHILTNYTISEAMEAKIVFRKGMCHYNLRDYAPARDNLLAAYQISNGSGLADDALYFLARAETNLGQGQLALSYYRQLLEDHPQSSLADDALYRMGRIHFFDDQLDQAIEKYSRLIEQYPASDRIGEVSWALGWIHYNNQDWALAESIFSNMAASLRGTALEEQGLFWQAQCLSRQGRSEDATALLKRIVSSHSYSYYMFMSQAILQEQNIEATIAPFDQSANPLNDQVDAIMPQVFEALQDNGPNPGDLPAHIERAIELLKIEMFASASSEIEAGQEDMDKEPVQVLMLSTLYYQSQDYRNSIRMLTRNRRALSTGLESPYRDYYYYLMHPYSFEQTINAYAREFDVDPLFVLAVMRQESMFQPEVTSFAGARGLMQIMPATGTEIAQKLYMDDFDIDQLYNPQKSIMMGTFYLREQLDNFENNKIYASGAYNGGPGAMSRWISRWGDQPIYEFVENIPFDETRDYVKRVMANYHMYRMLYG